MARQGAELDLRAETEEVPPHVLRQERTAERQETPARLTALSAEVRPSSTSRRKLGNRSNRRRKASTKEPSAFVKLLSAWRRRRAALSRTKSL